IRIGPDHTGWASPWFLVAVEDPKTDDVVVFTCNRSIDTEKLNSPHIYYPSHTNDVDDLLALEADSSEDWKLVKKTKKAMIFRKKSPENDLVPPIIKADLHLQGIPYKTAVQYFTDWEVRQRWDKTFGVVDILEKIGKFKVVYCSNKMPTFCKNRDMVLACLDHPGQQYHIQIMCSILHPVVPQNLKTNKIRANTSSFGIIIRPVDDGTQSSKVTVITQVDLKGSAPKFIKNGYLENNPIKWIKMMKKYYKKHGHEEEAGAKDQGTTESINNNVDDVIA
ncbi:uncharacterized protein LOC110254146, partial [Exaiptasia diaphana]|uniref:START domain-containing protein n=1 Tax=Exaiptasia diaphana TaxID=2652724 RepID=A0A913Y927_EXADI